MSSSKRKLKSVTLHDFFNAGGGPSVSLKGQKLTPKHSPVVPPENRHSNVIVIEDSDSEPEVVRVIQSKKRRHQSASSEEVEFVETAATTAPFTRRVQEGTSLKRQCSPSVLDLTSNPAPSLGEGQVTLSFGAPSLLLNTAPGTLSTSKPPSETLQFGKPTLLLGAHNITASLNQGTCSSISIEELPCTSSADEPEDMDFGLPGDTGDDWDTGDDEIAFARPSDEDDEEVEDMSMQASSTFEDECIKICPSCDMLLDGFSHFELVKHVNDCLDSGEGHAEDPSSSDKSGGPEGKNLQPLTSLVPPKFPVQTSDGPSKSSLSGNAFSVLMSSHKENEVWKEATVAETRDFRPNKSNGGRRKAPFYKVLQGMPIAVDAFRYGTIPGVNAYFLTHAHSDHYTNLASNWKGGPIYCSEGTANLIIHMLSVDRKWVHPLPYDIPTEIPNTGGVRVTLIQANHCPGSCLFFYEGRQTVNAGDSTIKSSFIGSTKIFRYLHCGDFRASPRHVLHPAVKGKRIDHVYLDTTYLDPKYTFPPQPLVISACAELAQRLVAGEPLGHTSTVMDTWTTSSKGKQTKTENTLIIVGTYSIGKERIVKAIAHALKSKVYCDARKAAILRCQADAELDALLTSNPLEATVHLVPLGLITSDKLKTYVERFKGKFSKAAGFRPTGWTYTQPTGTNQVPNIASIISRPHRGFNHASLRPARNSTPSLQLFPVPYSEHSSFFELTCFAMSFDWGKMIATVNVGSESSRGKMAKWVARWEAERKKRGKDTVIPHRHIEYW